MHWLYSDPGYNTALLAALALTFTVAIILGVIGYVISSFFLMRVFEKAGVQGKWRAWVPVYNLLVFAKLGDLSPWVMLGAVVASAVLGQIPVIGFIFSLLGIAAAVVAGWRVGLKLQKDWPYLLLWLIPGVGTLIWLGILAFGASRWNPNIAPAPWAGNFLADKTVWTGIPVQPTAAVAGPGAVQAGGYAPPQGYQAPPQGYQAPPQGYQPPPQGYQAPPPAGDRPVATPVAPTTQPPAGTDQPPAAPPVTDVPPADPNAPRP